MNDKKIRGGWHSEFRKTAVLVKCGRIFVMRTLVLLLLLRFLPVSRGEETKKDLAMEPRSVVFNRYTTGKATFSPDGKKLFWSCFYAMHTRVVDSSTELQPVMLKGAWFEGLSPDGSIAVFEGKEEDKEGIAEVEKMEGLTQADKEKTIEALGLRDGGDWFVALWKVKTGERLRVLKAYRNISGGGSRSAIFSPDGKSVLVTADSSKGNAAEEAELMWWEMSSGKLRRAFKLKKKHFLPRLQFSPDGKTLVIADYVVRQEYGKPPQRIRDRPSHLELWDVATGKMLAEYKGMKGWINTIAFSPDGKLLAVGGDLGSPIDEIIVWDVAKKEKRAILTGHRGPVAVLTFSHDGKLLASAGGGGHNGELRLWDVKNFQELRNLTGHTASLTSIAFSPDDRLLASGSGDGTVRLWHLYESAKAKREP